MYACWKPFRAFNFGSVRFCRFCPNLSVPSTSVLSETYDACALEQLLQSLEAHSIRRFFQEKYFYEKLYPYLVSPFSIKFSESPLQHVLRPSPAESETKQ